MTDASATPAFDSNRVASWYSGRARDRVLEILPRVAASVARGQWEPRLSRTAHAALSRQVTRSGSRLVSVPGDAWRMQVVKLDGLLALGRDGDQLYVAMTRGQFFRAADLIEAARRVAARCVLAAGEACSRVALAWAEDFAPLAAAFAALDAARPRPRYAFREISRTVLDNVGRTMGLAFETVRMPEIEWIERDVLGRSGETVKVWFARVLWPEGTRHRASRFASGSQCEACGHGIRSGHWVPLVLDGPGGPASLWVGRDCARHLFGCLTSGARDAQFERSLGSGAAGSGAAP